MKFELTSSRGARLILVNPGSFIMGSPSDEVGRAYFEREREVTLPHETRSQPCAASRAR